MNADALKPYLSDLQRVGSGWWAAAAAAAGAGAALFPESRLTAGVLAGSLVLALALYQGEQHAPPTLADIMPKEGKLSLDELSGSTFGRSYPSSTSTAGKTGGCACGG